MTMFGASICKQESLIYIKPIDIITTEGNKVMRRTQAPNLSTKMKMVTCGQTMLESLTVEDNSTRLTSLLAVGDLAFEGGIVVRSKRLAVLIRLFWNRTRNKSFWWLAASHLRSDPPDCP